MNIDSQFISLYKEEMLRNMQQINPDWDEEKMESILDEMIKKNMVNPKVTLDNNYIGETRDTTLLSVFDWVLDRKPLIAGNGTFYKNQYEAMNPIAELLNYFLSTRKKLKKEMFKIENCKVGDTILVVQRANGSSYAYNGYRRDYHEYRGNGDKDRAHDAHVSTGLNKINAIIEQRSWVKAEMCVFVSAEKEYSYSGARANVRIDEDEYINLTWVSSNHIQYWIDSKKIGGFSCNSYAQLCTLLKESLQHVVNREKEEFELINKYTRYAYVPKHIDKLTEWKFENRVRRLHSRNVKKFIYTIES